MTGQADITRLLGRWRDGDQAAFEQLAPMVYDELRRLARNAFRGERPAHTLQPTALVHEAFSKLAGSEVDWQDRSHFYALCARMMRRILLDHARTRAAEKRGGPQLRVTLNDDVMPDECDSDRLFALERALEKLAELDARKAELIELQLFGGLSYREMATVTGLSNSTLDRELRFAKAWLKAELSDD